MLGDRKRRDGYEEEADIGVSADSGAVASGSGGSSEFEGRVFWVSPLFGPEGDQITSGIGSDGKEYPCPIPDAVDTGLVEPVNILRTIDSMIRSQALRDVADREGFDTPEEAMDLEYPGEEEWPKSDYEENFDPEPDLASAAQAPAPASASAAPATGGGAPPITVSPPPSSPDETSGRRGAGGEAPTAGSQHSTHIT